MILNRELVRLISKELAETERCITQRERELTELNLERKQLYDRLHELNEKIRNGVGK